MSRRIEKLRAWLLGSAVFLMLLIAAFIGLARYARRHVLGQLLAKRVAGIKGEFNDFTFSDFDNAKGKTIYTIHAAKTQEHTDGKISLYDASIVLYGAKGDRADRIYGKEFEYDQKTGVIRAIGLVHIDLQAAGGSGVATSGDRAAKGPRTRSGGPRQGGPVQPKIIHATTSGLVYMKNLGVAATGEPIDFQLDQMTGHAIGADYNTDSDVLMLHSAVTMSGIASGHPLTITATSAQLDNRNQLAYLTTAKYISQGKTATADEATLHSRTDGTLARVEAQGNVTAVAKGATAVAAHADVLLNERSQPQSAVLTGGVTYTSDQPLRQARAQADASTLAFDAKGDLEHAVFTGAVHGVERTRATADAREPWSTRDLTASKFEAALVPIARGKSQLRDAEATGNPHLVAIDNGNLASTRGEGRTELSADDLKAHLVSTTDTKRPTRIDTLSGRGHTVLVRLGADGIEQTSAGDTLDAKFRPPGSPDSTAHAAASAASQPAIQNRRQASDTLLSAVQEGHVTVTRRVPAKLSLSAKAGPAKPDDVQEATAQRAIYDGDLDRMTLTGSAQLTDAGSVLWANQVALDHKTGDAHAAGAVKVDYVQTSSAKNSPAAQKDQAEPMHILADRADLNHSEDVATFYGKPVRMWQGGSQVQAPEVEFARAQKRLIARGDGSQSSAHPDDLPVHTILVAAGGGSGPFGFAPGSAGAAKKRLPKPAEEKASLPQTATTADAPPKPPHVARIASHELVYLGALHQAEFSGGFRAVSADGILVAQEATAFLQPADASQPADPSKAVGAATDPAANSLSFGGHIERIVATRGIQIDEPGRHATGERLVYTASDDLYLLTGDTRTRPKLVDTVQGTTVTGAALLFHAGDQSVEALSTVPGEKPSGQRVETNTMVKKQAKNGRAAH